MDAALDRRGSARPFRSDRALLGAQIANLITERIRREQIPSGTPLPSESELAEEYGASQRVVRDALRALSQQGVIRTQQGKRAEVSDLRPVAVRGYFGLALAADSDAIAELLELRLSLEGRAAALAAERFSAEDQQSLASLLDEAESADLDPQRRLELDLGFHMRIVRASGNRFYSAIVEALSDALADDRRKGQEIPGSAEQRHAQSDEEHRAILQALTSADNALAEELMRSHLTRVRNVFKDVHTPG